jgi:ATP synthase F1 gamma subunit
MRRAIAIQEDLDQIHVVEDLTGVFESVASIKIARIRNRVVASKAFFAELWETYRGLRVDPKEQLLRNKTRKTNGRNVLVAVTTEGKLSGEIGNKVIDDVVASAQESKDIDIIVLGSYGAVQLRERGVKIKQVFKLPASDVQFSVADIIDKLQEYEQITVFYQMYESLRIQRVGRIGLISAVHELSDEVGDSDTAEIVSSHEYIFEPDAAEIANYLESLMLGVALTQVLMESKLAQFASRFNAMNAAKHRAHDLGAEYALMYHRAKRAEGDERLKEIMKVVNAQRGMI